MKTSSNREAALKRLRVLLPVCMFIFVSACGVDSVQIPNDTGTAVALTQTATVQPPTATSTPNPDEAKIVEWLNEYLNSTDGLQQTFDVKFQVGDVFFSNGIGNTPPTTFRLDTHCECANNQSCCTPERTFVMIMWAMKNRGDKIIEQVPSSVVDIQVVCFDHGTQVGIVVASWQDVKDYISDRINGYQLGSRARTISFSQ